MTEIDEIMAAYLLKGAKMLAKTCTVCHAPLFEYKGDRFCVVCTNPASVDGESISVSEAELSSKPDMDRYINTYSPTRDDTVEGYDPMPQTVEASSLEDSISDAIVILCRRMVDDPDPARCAVYMKTIKDGARAIQILRNRHHYPFEK